MLTRNFSNRTEKVINWKRRGAKKYFSIGNAKSVGSWNFVVEENSETMEETLGIKTSEKSNKMKMGGKNLIKKAPKHTFTLFSVFFIFYSFVG